MRASVRLLVAFAWLGAAGTSGANAQADPSGSGVALQGCGPVCQFMHGQQSGQPAQTAQPQPQIQEQVPEPLAADRPRRPRRTTVQRAPAREAPRDAPRDGPREATAAEQDSAQEPRAERRPRTKAAERERAKPEGRVRRAAPVPEDVEQTASVEQNPGEVLFVSGSDEAHRAIAGDLAGIVGPDLALRTIPGRGIPLRDVLSLPGADVTITSSLTLTRGSAYADKVVYLAKLFTEELHAVAGPGIARLEDLAGKSVHLGPPDSDSEAAARAFLEARGIAVTPVGGSFAGAAVAVREGRIAAAFVLAPKPFAPISELRSGEGLRLLPLAYRSSDAAFYPAALSAADYPGLLETGERVETVALDAVLVAPRWRENTPRQRELAAFTTHLFERLGKLSGEGRHPKWKETNLATGVEGFWRLKPAEQWVAARLKQREAGSGREAGPERDSNPGTAPRQGRVAGETR